MRAQELDRAVHLRGPALRQHGAGKLPGPPVDRHRPRGCPRAGLALRSDPYTQVFGF